MIKLEVIEELILNVVRCRLKDAWECDALDQEIKIKKHGLWLGVISGRTIELEINLRNVDGLETERWE